MNLDDLEALLAAATPGPWMHGNGALYPASPIPMRIAVLTVGAPPRLAALGRTSDPNDAAAIVALMNAAPALLRVAKVAMHWEATTPLHSYEERELAAAVAALEEA